MPRKRLLMRKGYELKRGSVRAALIFIATLYLTACGVSNVVIEGSFPTPNIKKLPLTVAVYYDSTLTEFVYIEYIYVSLMCNFCIL